MIPENGSVLGNFGAACQHYGVTNSSALAKNLHAAEY